MAEEVSSSGELRFSVDSSLLFQLGERLVAKPSIALAELVKNAYDADTTKVTVIFEKVGQPGGVIVIEDDGHGMTFEEIRDNWMRIATTNKSDNPVSRKYCRPVTGAKGVGRFAARRLGSKLILQSIAMREDNTKESVVANFNWEEKFKAGQDLNTIPVTYTRQKVPLTMPTGVSLFIEGVRDSWSKDEINNVRRDLLSLQSPFPDLIKPEAGEIDGCIADPGFDLNLKIESSENLNDLSGGLSEAFLTSAWAKLDGEVDQKGIARYQLEILKTGEKNALFDDEHIYDDLKGVRFRIFFMVYRQDFFIGSPFTIREAQRKGREDGGVRLYLDGFRVFPYGDKGDDWMQLDFYAARNIDIAVDINPPKSVRIGASRLDRPFLLIPKNYQVFGAVLLSQQKHENINVNISRERVLETPTFINLRLFLQNGIYWMTVQYAAFIYEKENAIYRREPRIKTVPEIIEQAKTAIATQPELPLENREEIISSLDLAIEQSKREEEERISEVSLLRVLASAGTTILIMNHQLRALTGGILGVKEDFLRLRPEIPGGILEKYDDATIRISEWHEMVEQQISQLQFLLAPDSREDKKRYVLREVVENVRKPMSYYMNKYGIEFENNVTPTLRTPYIYLAELYAVLINILSNALKAVLGQPKRSVTVEAFRENKTLILRMKDTGVGVPLERREIVFKPFKTTSLPNPVLGVGTGLGLKVVRDLLETYDGTARFIDVELPWKTCIEIRLPE